jgi:transposase
MSSGSEGLLTLTIKMRVSPEPMSRANRLDGECPRCRFEADGDTVAVLNIEMKALSKIGDL